MRLLFLIIILFLTTNAIAQRYRVVADTTFKYSDIADDFIPYRVDHYIYNDNKRGNNWRCDTVYYDSMYAYYITKGIVEQLHINVQYFDDNDKLLCRVRLDTFSRGLRSGNIEKLPEATRRAMQSLVVLQKDSFVYHNNRLTDYFYYSSSAGDIAYVTYSLPMRKREVYYYGKHGLNHIASYERGKKSYPEYDKEVVVDKDENITAYKRYWNRDEDSAVLIQEYAAEYNKGRRLNWSSATYYSECDIPARKWGNAIYNKDGLHIRDSLWDDDTRTVSLEISTRRYDDKGRVNYIDTTALDIDTYKPVYRYTEKFEYNKKGLVTTIYTIREYLLKGSERKEVFKDVYRYESY